MGSLFGAITKRLSTNPTNTLDISNRGSLPTSGGNFTGGLIHASNSKELEAFAASSTLFSIVDRIASSVASIDWRLYYRNPFDIEKEREEVARHPALSTLWKPSTYTTLPELLEASMQHFDLTGEFWWLLNYAGSSFNGPPLSISTIRPDRIKPVFSKSDELLGYEYRINGERIPLDVKQILSVRRPSPIDSHRGISPVAALLLDLDGERAAAAYNAMFFANSALPGGFIEYDKVLNDSEFENLLMRWREQHKGVSNAHRVAVLEKGATFKERSVSNRDMEFTELRRFNQETVRRAFGIPKFALGDVDDVNRANAEASTVFYSQWVIMPRADRIQRMLNNFYLPLFGEGMSVGYEFDYDDPTPPDKEQERANENSKVERAIKLIAAGFDAEDVLEYVGLPEMGWSDRFQGNQQPPQQLSVETPEDNLPANLPDTVPVNTMSAMRHVVMNKMGY